MKNSKRGTCVLLALAFILSLSPPAAAIAEPNYQGNTFNSEHTQLTEEEILQEIANGKATVTTSIRDFSEIPQEEIDTHPGLADLSPCLGSTSRDINYGTAYGKVIKETVVTSNNDVIEYYSSPTCYIEATDLGSYGSGNISTALEIQESVFYNGEYTNSFNNLIQYANIEVRLGCGENSRFTSSVRVVGSNSDSGSFEMDYAALFGLLAGAFGKINLSHILNALSTITITTTAYSKSYNIPSKENDPQCGVAVKWKPKSNLGKSGDILSVESSFSTYKSSETKNVTTEAAAVWTFDIHRGVPIQSFNKIDSIKLSPHTSYIVNGTNT